MAELRVLETDDVAREDAEDDDADRDNAVAEDNAVADEEAMAEVADAVCTVVGAETADVFTVDAMLLGRIEARVLVEDVWIADVFTVVFKADVFTVVFAGDVLTGVFPGADFWLLRGSENALFLRVSHTRSQMDLGCEAVFPLDGAGHVLKRSGKPDAAMRANHAIFCALEAF